MAAIILTKKIPELIYVNPKNLNRYKLMFSFVAVLFSL